MKGFIQGFLFILVIILIIGFFQLIGYIDVQINGEVPTPNSEASSWNESDEQPDGVYNRIEPKEMNSSAKKNFDSDFGSKPLNQKDRDKSEENKQDRMKKSFKGF